MMENHSFDNLLGMVPLQVPGRELADGFTIRRGQPTNFNPDGHGHPVYARPDSSPCQLTGEPTQAWNASHEAYARGRNDGFVKASGPIAMRFWDQTNLPFTYPWSGTSRSGSGTSVRCWPRRTPIAASCSPGPRRG